MLRDSKWVTIDAKELVPGDIVQVASGDCVPADLRVVEIKSIALQAGQAALTGESVSVQKTTRQMGADVTILQDQKNILFASTTITSGNAVGVVAYTGMHTALGNVHAEVSAAKGDEEDTPLKQKIDQFGETLARVIFVICFLVWAMNYNKFFDPIHGTAFKGCIYYFKIAVALAVAAIPEGLPAVITTCLALGTRKMAANNCIVRRLMSVETLGCTSTICSDKTGTLTKNEMCAIKFGAIGYSYDDITEYKITENSYSPEADIQGFSQETYNSSAVFAHIANVCAINNRARIVMKDGAYKIQGEPTEAALKVFAEKLGKYSPEGASINHKATPMGFADKVASQITEIATLEFSSERKAMSTLVTGYEGSSNNTVLLKGAPEKIIQSCSHVYTTGRQQKPLTYDDKQALIKRVQTVAAEGYRVLGLAFAPEGGNMKQINKDNARDMLADASTYPEFEANCSFLGYVCIQDPVRQEVRGAIEECRYAGINVIMITGDSKETAVAIAKQLNIIE